jgi:Cu(I)/Ag(I) efflux system membrane fusion protein
MKKSILVVTALVVALFAGLTIGRWSAPDGQVTMGGDESTERDVLYWVAPMDPNFRRDEPGKSPMGMDLVAVYADEVDAVPGTVKIDPTVVNNLGVRTEVAQKGPLSRRIETVGYVGFDEDTLQHVHTRVEGWIEKLATKASGDAVKKGQLLFELYSPTLVNAQQEYLAATSSGNTMLRNASKDRLTALGVMASEIARLEKERTASQRVRVYAEADGVIAHLGVREGIFVTPATEIMSVARLDKVWVLAGVFERQAAWLEPGQQAEVELDYLPGKRWLGTVDYIYPELDVSTRTLKVRIRFDNEGEVLRPNMFARVTLFGTETDPVVHVPREALIRGGNDDRVVLSLGDGRYRSQHINTGIESGDRVAILNGLSAGDRVVTSGQFLIDSESNIESSLARMSEREEKQ